MAGLPKERARERYWSAPDVRRAEEQAAQTRNNV